MSYQKKLRLLITFYSAFVLPAIIVSISSAAIIAVTGFKILAVMIWFKVITMAIIVYYINTYKRKEFYYYQNLGLSKKLLWTYTLGLDFFLFLIMFIIILKFNIHLKF